MTYDESPVEVQYERCKQAMEILRNNVKDAQTMAAIDDAYKNSGILQLDNLIF